MKSVFRVVVLVFFPIFFYGQAPNISYSSPNTFIVNQSIESLIPINAGGSIPNQPFVSTIAGTGNAGFADGIGTSAIFNLPTVVTPDLQNNLIVVDRSNHRIRKITPSGDVVTIAGTGVAGSLDGPGNIATFRFPDGAVVDSQGNIFITDQSNHRLRKIAPDGIVTTVAGSSAGNVDGIGLAAKFRYPAAMTIDANDNLYIADWGNNTIRKVTPDGIVSTYAGTTAGFLDGSSSVAKFSGPTGLGIDSLGNVYVADYNNNRIRKIDTLGEVTTIAGNGTAGAMNGNGLNATFNNPSVVSVDAENNLFVTDYTNHLIRKIDAFGEVTTYAGSGFSGSADGYLLDASFKTPTGIMHSEDNTIYISDYGNHKIRKIKKYGYTVVPSLPSGLFLDFETGIISGTPTQETPMMDYVVTAENQYGSAIFNMAIEVQETLTSSEFPINNLKIYPNPVTDFIKVVGSQNIDSITVFNLIGQQILTSQDASFIDVSHLPHGYYPCVVMIDDEISTLKFIKR